MAGILSKNQIRILDKISKDKSLCSYFYLTGGTALAEYYLEHRLSEDLDFFSENEFDVRAISVFFKKVQVEIGVVKVEYQQSFNRNLFFLHLKDEVIKTEFTYFPFPRIEKTLRQGNLEIDSLMDIAVNKIFTIYQKPRSRDFIDLYFINKKTGWKLGDLAKKAQLKFETYLDPLQLGSQYLLCTEAKDFPVMKTEADHGVWQEYFKQAAKELEKEVLE